MVSSHLVQLIIAGQTGSGKSSLALKLALKHNGEIICADSRQFYSHMRIGTASPSEHDRMLVAHHGFNIIDPRDKKIDAGFFVGFAKEKIADCQRRNKRPIIVGGTGLYLRSLRYGLTDVPPSDKVLVLELEKIADEQGLSVLYDELLAVDPASAALINALDRYRIIRSLEIYRQCGLKPSALRQSFSRKEPIINAHWMIKIVAKELFLVELKRRVETMVQEGLIEEAIELRNMLPQNHWALSVMGYEEALSHVDGHMSKEAMIERIFIRHRQYAKRQATWFKNEAFYRWHV